jgi:hypothetical protein
VVPCTELSNSIVVLQCPLRWQAAAGFTVLMADRAFMIWYALMSGARLAFQWYVAVVPAVVMENASGALGGTTTARFAVAVTAVVPFATVTVYRPLRAGVAMLALMVTGTSH